MAGVDPWNAIGPSKPTSKQLGRYVIPRVAAKWHELGIELYNDEHVFHLDRIQKEHPGDFTEACTKMFKFWGDTYTNATWKKLIKAIKAPGLQLNAIAADIKKDLVTADDDSDDDSGPPGAPAVNTTSTPAVNTTSTPAVEKSSSAPAADKLSETGALQFFPDQKMHIAFKKLTDAFVNTIPPQKLSDIIQWCQEYCSDHDMNDYEFSHCSLNDLFKSIKKLPYHNCLNTELLHELAERSNIECLIQSVKNYNETFSECKLNTLALEMGEQIQEIQIIKRGKNCSELVTKLEDKDLTVGQLHGLTTTLDKKVLYLRAGVMVPQWIKEGCICIVWFIPPYLVEHAYNSACLNVKLFPELNLLYVQVGKFRVEVKSNIAGTQLSPSQIFCKYYLYLMEKLQPIQVSKMLYYKRIFSYYDLDAILNTPIDHMKSFYIIEYFRLMGATGILEFVYILNVISSQKEISSILRNTLELNGYTIASKDVDLSGDTADVHTNCDEKISNLKCINQPDMQRLLPDLDKSEYTILPNMLLIYYLDLCDSIIELLQASEAEQIIKVIDSFLISDQPVKLFSDNFIKSLKNSPNTNMILRRLFLYSRWYDVSIIEELVLKCDCQRGVQLLDWFNSHINRTLPILRYPMPAPFSFMIKDESNSHFLMAMRYRREHCTLSDITTLKLLLLQVFEIKGYACILVGIVNPDILYWLLPNSVFTIVCKKISEHIDYLCIKGITDIAISPNITFSASGKQSRQAVSYFTFENKESQKYQPLNFDEFWANLQWQTVQLNIQDLSQLLSNNNSMHFKLVNSEGDTPLTYLLNNGILLAIELLKPFGVDASKVDLAKLIMNFGKKLTQGNLRDLIELGSKSEGINPQLRSPLSYAVKINKNDLSCILYNEMLKDAPTTMLPGNDGSLRPKEADVDSFEKTVLQKVDKLINMPSKYFVECIENESKILDNDDDDDEEEMEEEEEEENHDVEENDSSDHDDVVTRQESIQFLTIVKETISDCDDYASTSGYVSESLPNSSSITIADTETLFSKNSEEDLDRMSTNDKTMSTEEFVQSDSDGIVQSQLSLDKYAWEVECTKEFWKSFTKLHQPLKHQVLTKINRLAKGEWRNFIPAKTTKGHGLHLFYINVTTNLRIIWQLAITYSPRRTAKCRSEGMCAETDVIYSQIIRIWKITAVESMKKSIKLIQEALCKKTFYDPAIGSKNLKILTSGENDVQKSTPTLYCLIKSISVYDECVPVYYPADHKNTPLQLYKMDDILFYSTCSMSLNNYQGFLLEQKLSPEENDIINIDPQKSIVLLGRSGTGKTICCLHRLWKQFNDYWIKKIQDKEEVTAAQDHLRQAFITKSSTLCSRFKRRFCGFMLQRETWQNFLNQQFPNGSRVNQIKIQEFHPHAFPCFLTSRSWLLLLDLSLEGENFFNYSEDGSLSTNIIESDYMEGNFEGIKLFDEDLNQQFPTSKQQKQNWRKVDSEFFTNKIWPKLKCNKAMKVDPILVWMEIHSFIKGSFKALKSTNGQLTREEYIKFGVKMAPNFKDNRDFAYNCFEEYELVKQRKGYFDDNDLVYNLFNRLIKMKNIKPLIHQLYIDEVQDFTQAELALLLRCSYISSGHFLTGDTAQNIMRSVSFRFCDLQSLFYDFQENLDRKIEVPKINILLHNFRSHSGILQLAASVIDLLMKFFKSSLDRLPADQGMFSGPKPVLISSRSHRDLVQIFTVSREESVAIEFGAKQAIIVRSEQARTNLPDELKVGIVLTVNEAKGLEFDDVLLYNFFADSQINEQWRIVTSFTDEYTERNSIPDTNILKKPRPLKFNEEQHKMLNSELKLLYTAVTRARSKLWVFDCSDDERAPIFHYFVQRELVEYLSNETVEATKPVTSFSSKSSVTQWKRQGDFFKEKGLWNPAVTCYNKADTPLFSKDALGHHYMQLAITKLSQQKYHYLVATNYFYECLRLQPSIKYLEKVASCLYNAQQHIHAAELFEKLNMVGHAIQAYQKVGTTEALQKAIALQKDSVDKAISTCLMDKTGKLLPTALKLAVNANPPSFKHSVSDLALRTSNYYIKDNKPGHALETAIFIVVDERKRFYKDNGFDAEYIDLLQKTKNFPELYRFLKGCDKFEEGANIAKKFNDKENYIIFVIMIIRSKLSKNISCYSKVAQQNDAKELRSLLNNVDHHLQQQLLYYIVLLEGRNDYKNLKGYLKCKAFDLYVGVFKDNSNVPVIFKHLCLLLELYNSNSLDLCMVKFFDILNIEKEYFISPLMRQELRVSNARKYKKDEYGMTIMDKSQLLMVFRKHTKSIAKNWLKILDEILAYKEEYLSSYVKVQDLINVIHYSVNILESKYYYHNFDLKMLEKDISAMLIKLLNYPWICYIPAIHLSVGALTNSPAINSIFSKEFGIKNTKMFVEKWVFHGFDQEIVDFTSFTNRTIKLYLSTELSEIKMIDFSPVVSNLEIITIGLLGIFSNINHEREIVIPQSYEIATGFFDSFNCYNLFSLITASELSSVDIFYFFHLIIKILLGDTHFKSMLSMAACMEYPKNHPIQYQFERCIVLALTLLGNLASDLATDVNVLFHQSFMFLKTLTSKLKSHQKDFIPIINEFVNAFNTKEVFLMINKIQQLHFRSMVTFDFPNSCFKAVLPENFPYFPLYCKPKISGPVFADNASLNTTQGKHIKVPRELKLLPHFMLTKEQKVLYGQFHIDEQVKKNS